MRFHRCVALLRYPLVSAAVSLCTTVWFVSCSSLLVPHPPVRITPAVLPDTVVLPEPEVETPGARPVAVPSPVTASRDDYPQDSLDFSVALSFDDAAGEQEPEVARRDTRIGAAASVAVRSDWVRVALRRNRTTQIVYSASEMELRTAAGLLGRVRGRIELRARESGIEVVAQTQRVAASLPCTLRSPGAYGQLEVDSSSYRGWLIVERERDGGGILVVNYLPVEEYLRGVVPLEIGARGPEYLAALKAQAVAARTYTYRRCNDRAGELFDVHPTVADQVYGGSLVESRHCDAAVSATANTIMVYNDSLVTAYYHSTCGGRTATVSDVWDRPFQPYLVSVPDRDDEGTPWCAASRYLQWESRWSASRLGAILSRHGTRASVGGRFAPPVQELVVHGNHACGRISRLVIHSAGGVLETGADAARFALRRDEPGNPILPSSRFAVRTNGPREFVVAGSGFGHGVGMCQMGALGRARAGQSWEQILRAYYTSVVFAQVVVAPPMQR